MRKTPLIPWLLTAAILAATPLSAHAATGKQIRKDETGTVHNVIGALGKVAGATAEARALAALDLVKGDFGFDKAAGNFAVLASHKDESGVAHTKLNQIIGSIPVVGHQMIVHERNGEVLGVTGHYTRLTPTATAPAIHEEEAIDAAIAHTAYTGVLSRQPSAALVYLPVEGKAVLTYAVNVAYVGEQVGNWTIDINGADGTVTDAIDKTARVAAKGTGTGVAGDTKSINTDLRSGAYHLEDLTRPMANGGKIRTRDFATGTNRLFAMADADNVWSAPGQRAAVDAHFHAGKVYDFYRNMLGRDSLDGKGGSIELAVRYGNKYNGAFWDGSLFIFGDGDGTWFRPLSGALDIVAHEMTHAVIDATSGLIYRGQAGALSESWADAMAAAIDADDWLIGEDVYTPATIGDAMRSLADPGRYGDPGHMAQYVMTTDDNGGVHANAGIPNKAFHNFATSIGSRSVAAKIWYTASRDYMISSTNFSGARAGTLQAAAGLYGSSSSYYTALQQAWSSVGVE